MLVQEILDLVNWFNSEIVSRNIHTSYTNLFNKMNHNSNVNANQKQPFDDEKEALLSRLTEINLTSLSLEQIDYLKKLGVYNLLGKNGVDLVNDALYKNALDIVTATKIINENQKLINNAIANFNSLEKVLSNSFEIEDSQLDYDEIRMRIYFKDKASIDNLADFKELSNQWYTIAHGIALVTDSTPEDLRIIGAQNGSVIIDLAVASGIANIFGKILVKSLEIAEKYFRAMQEYEKWRALKLGNEILENDMKNQVEAIRKRGIEDLSNDTVDELELKKTSDGDKITALKKSIELLFDFTEKGGNIDIIASSEEDDNEEDNEDSNNENLRNLRESMSSIRELENRIKLLEQNNNDE